ASGSTFDIHSWFLTTSFNNDTISSYAPLLIRDPYNYSNPDFRLQSTSPLLNNSGFVGINENDFSSIYISIYPNLVNDILNIHFQNNVDEASVQILDIMGRIFYNEVLFDINNDLIINTASLPSGTYIIRIINSNDFLQKSFIKL
ncbi:MAG: T9SS type A sorting domain-containing protein, partial [Bacteroidales bacterium]|nr:T9SS type A sorting domain-containing protein [Bacteroidales bacterium]